LTGQSQFLGYAAALSDGPAAYILWIIGALTLSTWLVGLSAGVRRSRLYWVLQTAALWALPLLLLGGMAASMMPPA
jgi:hypothetical protein